MSSHFPYSILDLALIREGSDAADAYARSLDLARHAETWGYKRIWLAEHHNMPYVGSSAPAILMGYIAGGTQSIKVGSGGIMMPNHSALMVAEEIGTLERLYPGRIDLGLGRAPGTDQRTASALRRGRVETVNDFPQDLEDLQRYFSQDNSRSDVRAFPAEGLDVPIYILGSSMSSAILAAERGLPYVFASHFAPAYFMQAVKYYQDHFRPSEYLREPFVMACINVIAADTDAEAHYLATSFYQMALGIVRQQSYPLRPPVEDMSNVWSQPEAAAIQNMMAVTYVGTRDAVREGLEDFVRHTGINEVMITSNLYDHAARLHSFDLAAQAVRGIKVG
ncbi:LLM class flavin-dependent oxidoreductase [Algoriphagus aestuariicola]|uniref:LLM class flavin-dependent oxidoreductase n=1 Tax=Algoriphagus aestuariicola TaxID=1852016 RepID=A0ABS3C018_9BACT|nr:LLM class flavin-dependent oxidoreductase [Algoriphagus aestuariicola]MBN7803324.1 LLM class flavin-dependent oxidoreductase [Algoriphagus aestuariicola]